MGLKQYITERLVGVEVARQLAAARLPAANTKDLSARDEGWRRLTLDEDRDLLPVTQDRMQEIAYKLWEANPFARWIIEIIKDFILAEGMPVEAAHEDVAEVVKEFWYDPVNRMDLYIDKHCRELHIFGELCFPAFTARQTGRLRLGYVDPQHIDVVTTDPENVKMVIAVVLKGKSGAPGRQYRTILPEGAEEILSPAARDIRAGCTDGECFFFSINNVTNSPRGRSELLPTADWLDAYEQFLFDYAERWPQMNAFVWDMMVTGGGDDEINKQLKAFTAKSGGVYGHNEKVTLEAKAPDLKSQDADTGARVLRNHILGGHGFPSFWFGGGEDANRALGVEMGTPAFKMMSGKQRYFRYVIESIVGEAISRARKAGYLIVSDKDADNWETNLPELASKDVTKYATALQQVSTSLVGAVSQGMLSKETATKIYAFSLSMIGYELDPAEEKKKVDQEEKDRASQDYRTDPGPKLGEDGQGDAETRRPGDEAGQKTESNES